MQSAVQAEKVKECPTTRWPVVGFGYEAVY